MKMSFASITALILSHLALTICSLAQDGSLDLSFDSDGYLTTAFGSTEDYGHAVAIQADGKIVVAGYSYDDSGDVFAVVRYNPDGSLDNTFDLDGRQTTAVGDAQSRAHAVAIQEDGKIVLVGFSYNGSDNDFTVVRYNIDGSLDDTFDSDGIVTTQYEEFSNDRAFALAIQSDGKIVVAGYKTNADTDRDFAIARYNSNGSLDDTFNTVGTVVTIIEQGNDEARSIVIQNDGKIIVTGYSFDFATRKFTTVRYNASGSLDSSFDGDGIVKTAIGPNDDAAYAVALQSDEKIVVTGYTHGETYDFATVRYSTDGSLDDTFDVDGIVVTPIGAGPDLPFCVVIQNDDKILVGGHSEVADNNFALVRYNSNGILDNTFNSDGKVTTEIGDLGSDDIIKSMALQSDGKIVAAGQSSDGDEYYFAVARYHNEGSSDFVSALSKITETEIYPNPFSIQTSIQTSVPLNNASLKVFNSFGQQVRELNNISGQFIELYRDNLADGLYYIQLFQDKQTISTAIIIIAD